MAEHVRYRVIIGLLGLSVIGLFGVSLLVGPANIGAVQGLRALFDATSDNNFTLIMREIRLPRALLGLMIGMALGLSGAVLQGYLRNPLAEPGLLGISSSASLGAVIALYSGISGHFYLALPIFALAGALFAVVVVQRLAGKYGGVLTVILIGIAISSLTGALSSLILNLSPNPYAAVEILFWMLGSLSDRSLIHVAIAAPVIIAGCLMLACLGRPLDLLTLGGDTAVSMGVNLQRLQLLIIVGSAAAVAGGTAVAGSVGFVGLIVPHVLRPLVGYQPSRLLLASALGGAAMLMAADVLVRLIDTQREIKLGVLTALIGAPLFFWLVFKARREII